MRVRKKIITGDYIDEETGLRFIEDSRGNLHCIMSYGDSNTLGDIIVNIPEIKIPPIPESRVTVEVIPPADDPEKQRLIRIMERLRQENNWLWGEILKSIINRKRIGAAKAMDLLENAINERQRE